MEYKIYALSNMEETYVFSANLIKLTSAEALFEIKDKNHLNKIQKADIIRFKAEESYSEAFEGTPKILSDGNLLAQNLVNLTAQSRDEVKFFIRIPSYLYYKKNGVLNRRQITISDISCGGARFECDAKLDTDTQYEVVIPITDEPLIMDITILRADESANKNVFVYGTKFSKVFPPQEKAIRESIFLLEKMRRNNQKKESCL